MLPRLLQLQLCKCAALRLCRVKQCHVDVPDLQVLMLPGLMLVERCGVAWSLGLLSTALSNVHIHCDCLEAH